MRGVGVGWWELIKCRLLERGLDSLQILSGGPKKWSFSKNRDIIKWCGGDANT